MYRLHLSWIRSLLAAILVLLTHITNPVSSECTVPEHFRGDFFSMESGTEMNTLINQDSFENSMFEGTCHDREDLNSTIPGIVHSYNVFYSSEADCFKCFLFYYRTPNINQYKQSVCKALADKSGSVQDICGEITDQYPIDTFFRKSMTKVNCKNTFEGVYHFTYEIPESHDSPCKSPDSLLVACQEPGSPYVDNEVFFMYYGKCEEHVDSAQSDKRMQCMGTWEDEVGNIWSGVVDLEDDELRYRFRCLLTRHDQENYHDNYFRFTMSYWATCNGLFTYDYGDIIHGITPVMADWQEEDVVGCNFPLDYIGHWYYPSKIYDVDVDISRSEIYFKTKVDAYRFKEAYFTCVRTLETRYLMRVVTVGKCEIDYVCFDLLPRHQNVIRWRMSKPFRLGEKEQQNPDHMAFMFRQACDWTSFTYDRDDVNYLYNTFILNPPVSMPCPVRGRFFFEQSGPETELIRTRIRGITERPRHLTDCRQFSSLLYSCDENPSKIMLDVEYCESLDHTGRPIGEYDEPDFQLTCVGQWDENWNSYLITWDEEDETTPFRCWTYERQDWRHVFMARSTRAACNPLMRSDADEPARGASLNLKLTEAERLFDDCTMNYIEGDPWAASRYERVQNLNSGSHLYFNHLAGLGSAAILLTVYQYFS